MKKLRSEAIADNVVARGPKRRTLINGEPIDQIGAATKQLLENAPWKQTPTKSNNNGGSKK